MSKKRERAKANLDGDGNGDGDTTIQRGAESLLFEIAAAPDGTNTSSSSKNNKRSKSSATNKGNAKDDDEMTAAGAEGAGSELTAAVAATKSQRQQYHPAAITPSSALRECNRFDIMRKGARGRGRQLMVLPGALGLGNGGSGGTLGALKNATSACPVLYVEFPEVWNHYCANIKMCVLLSSCLSCSLRPLLKYKFEYPR